MTVLSIAQKASKKIGIAVPTAIFTDPSREMIEMAAMLNDAASAILDAYDWQLLKVKATFTGDGAATSFSLPADYVRMTKSSEAFLSTTPAYPMTHILDETEWMQLDLYGIQPFVGMWIIYGGQFHIKPTMATGVTTQFFYISDKFADNGSPTNAFTADTDTFRLDDKLLELALVWLWKEQKGLDYAEPLARYQDRLSVLIGNDQGPGTIAVGRAHVPNGVRVAYPRSLG